MKFGDSVPAPSKATAEPAGLAAKVHWSAGAQTEDETAAPATAADLADLDRRAVPRVHQIAQDAAWPSHAAAISCELRARLEIRTSEKPPGIPPLSPGLKPTSLLLMSTGCPLLIESPSTCELCPSSCPFT